MESGISRANPPGKLLVEDGLATIAEGAQFLRVSRATIYHLMDSQELAYAKIGRCRRIPWRALRTLAEQSLVGC